MSDALDFPWLRRIQVQFEKLRGGNTLTLESTGKPDALRITVHIQKLMNGVPTATQITIYNLSEDTRASFVNNETIVTIRAGWDFGPKAGMNVCFVGQLLQSVSLRSGAEIITTIHCLSGATSMAESIFCDHYPAGMPVSSIVKALAQTFPKVHVDSARIIGIEGNLDSGGWSYCGCTKNALDELKKQFGFSWSIVDQNFSAIGDRTREDQLNPLAYLADPYLIAVNPILNTVAQIDVGISFSCTFNSGILPLFPVNIKSVLSPKYNGKWIVSQITHKLDCYTATSFQTEGVAYRYGKGAAANA